MIPFLTHTSAYWGAASAGRWISVPFTPSTVTCWYVAAFLGSGITSVEVQSTDCVKAAAWSLVIPVNSKPIWASCAIFRFAPVKGHQIISRLDYIAKSESLDITNDAIEIIVYFAEGDMRRAVNILQASASMGETITEENIHDVVSKAKPKDVKKIVNKALDGYFLSARELLREVMVVQGTSGEDMVTQIYQEVSRMAMEERIQEDIYIKLIEKIGETDYRIREGSNPRIQLEALLAQFLINSKAD